MRNVNTPLQDWKSDRQSKLEEENLKEELASTINEHIIVSKYQVNNKLTLKVMTKPSYRYRKVTKALADAATEMTDFDKHHNSRSIVNFNKEIRSKSDDGKQAKKEEIATVTIDGFFSNNIHKKLKLEDVDHQMQLVKGQFLLRLNQDDFDSKEFAFYKKQIKGKKLELGETDEPPIKLNTLFRDDLIIRQKIGLEAKKASLNKKVNLNLDTSRNGLSDRSINLRDHGLHEAGADKLVKVMERHPDIFKANYLARHRRKLKRDSFLFNEANNENLAKTAKPEKLNSFSLSYLHARTKNMITSSLETIEHQLKDLRKLPQSVCQTRHPTPRQKRMESREPSFISKTTDLMESFRKPKPSPTKVKATRAIMSWLQKKEV